jgi:hypothetical protein
MTTVTGFFNQHNIVRPFSTPCAVPKPGQNLCGEDPKSPTNKNLWNYRQDNYGLCIVANCSEATECPRGIRPFPTFSDWVADDSSQFNGQSEGRPVMCSYSDTVFDTAEKIDIWINNFGITGPNTPGFNQIMSNFCGQLAPEGSCRPFANLPEPSTICKNGLTGCSMFSATGHGGDLCRNWAANFPGGYYQTGNNFCANNLCAVDCLCYNRDIVDPVYQIIQGPSGNNIPVPDVCWYTACKNAPEVYLQPANQSSNVNSCPDVCLQIITIINSKEIDINIANQTINCNFAATGSTGSGSDPSSLWDSMGMYVAVFGFALLIIVVVIICIAISSYEKK